MLNAKKESWNNTSMQKMMKEKVPQALVLLLVWFLVLVPVYQVQVLALTLPLKKLIRKMMILVLRKCKLWVACQQIWNYINCNKLSSFFLYWSSNMIGFEHRKSSRKPDYKVDKVRVSQLNWIRVRQGKQDNLVLEKELQLQLVKIWLQWKLTKMVFWLKKCKEKYRACIFCNWHKGHFSRR